MYAAESLARYSTASAISSASPSRLAGIRFFDLVQDRRAQGLGHFAWR